MNHRDPQQFVHWFRESSPYIHRFRGQTFVIAFGGEMPADGQMDRLASDLALLNSLGIHLVLVHGAVPQIDRRLAEAGLHTERVGGRRITDAAALPHIMAAVGALRVAIEACLTQSMPDSPMAGARLKVGGGNYVLAQPLGVLDGVDFQHTGKVRRVDAAAIQQRLEEHEIVLLSPLAYSPTGEIFNVSAEELATHSAIALRAAKLIFLMDEVGLCDDQGGMLRQLTVAQAEQRLSAAHRLPSGVLRHVESAVEACKNGVARAHLISRGTDGALLLELFTRDGCGTLISTTPFENLRPARLGDVHGIIELLQPLENEGILVKRSREVLEMQIEHFVVVERDGQTIACAAFFPYPEDGMAELACLAVHVDYRCQGRGDELLQFIVQQARARGLTRLFVLTTQTAHWFLERGFQPAAIDTLPMPRQQLYNYNRRSKVFIKNLD